jgi:hypothetical protein
MTARTDMGRSGSSGFGGSGAIVLLFLFHSRINKDRGAGALFLAGR